MSAIQITPMRGQQALGGKLHPGERMPAGQQHDDTDKASRSGSRTSQRKYSQAGTIASQNGAHSPYRSFPGTE